MEKTTIFDVERPIGLNLRTTEGIKTIRVRFPSDDEWIERQRRRKIIVKQLGRGMSETTIGNAEDVDSALLAKIRIADNNDTEVDPFEASRIIDQLSLAEVDDVIQIGDSFRVTLRVLGGPAVHLLKMPSAKDVIEYRRGFARVIDLPYGRQELTINLGAAGTLHRKLLEATEGYTGEVPIIHQAVAVKAAIDALDSILQETCDPN